MSRPDLSMSHVFSDGHVQMVGFLLTDRACQYVFYFVMDIRLALFFFIVFVSLVLSR